MPDTVVSVSVSLPMSTMTVGQSQQAAFRLTTDVTDGVADQQTPAWSSSAAATATVSTTGLVKAIAPGAATIRATIGAVSGQAAVTVSLVVVDITAAQETAIKAVPIGQTFQLRGPTTVFDVQVNA